MISDRDYDRSLFSLKTPVWVKRSIQLFSMFFLKSLSLRSIEPRICGLSSRIRFCQSRFQSHQSYSEITFSQLT